MTVVGSFVVDQRVAGRANDPDVVTGVRAAVLELHDVMGFKRRILDSFKLASAS